MPDHKKPVPEPIHPAPGKRCGKIKLEVYGEEMVEKEVRLYGINGRLYLPKEWVGRRGKIIRLD